MAGIKGDARSLDYGSYAFESHGIHILGSQTGSAYHT